jgi:alkyldihydroxyacetonephosphate synthase
MRRWNGWGDETVEIPLPDTALKFLIQKLGKVQPPIDATVENVLPHIPNSRLSDHPLVNKDPFLRLMHCRGQSLPDWIALRSGEIDQFPDGIAFPETADQVRSLLAYARSTGTAVIPYGGGTSVVGHINPKLHDRPVLTINLSRMNRLIDLDPTNWSARLGAGSAGPEVESQLRAHNFTLGHFPQSFEYSTLGGWVATRSCGQQSHYYGRIEQLFLGGNLETSSGTLKLLPFPASAAGPDLREMVLGSEGRLGILTEVEVRIRPLPECEGFHTVFFPDWTSGIEAVKTSVHTGIPLSMLRLSTPEETRVNLALAGNRFLTGALEKYLSMRRARKDRCMLIFGVTGSTAVYRNSLQKVLRIYKRSGGIYTGLSIGRKWEASRFRAPYLRNTLWEKGYALDTVETATNWRNVNSLLSAVHSAILEADRQPVFPFSHLSHVYRQGASIYTTLVFPREQHYVDTQNRWERLKHAVSEAITLNGGTISHQHGVGLDHAPYLETEKSKPGMEAIKGLCRQFDPEGVMNPGKLV